KLVETVLERQLAFERELVNRVLAPTGMVLDLAERTTVALEAQSAAFRAAQTALGQVADALDTQAELLRLTSDSLRDPAAALRSAGREFQAMVTPQAPAG